jgi:hypothetical protein
LDQSIGPATSGGKLGFQREWVLEMPQTNRRTTKLFQNSSDVSKTESPDLLNPAGRTLGHESLLVCAGEARSCKFATTGNRFASWM